MKHLLLDTIGLGRAGLLVAVIGLASAPRPALGQAGSIDPTFTPGPALLSVSRLAVQSGNRIVLAGPFTSFNGVAVSNLARLNPDGTREPGFDPGAGLLGTVTIVPGVVTNIAPVQVNALVVQADDKILVGGSFTTGSAPIRTNAARYNANGSLDGSFDVQPDATVLSFLPLAGGKVFLGGTFKKIRGTARTCVALVNGDGSLDNGFNPNWGAIIPGSVQGIAVQADGKVVVVGGLLRLSGGLVPLGAARFDSAGNLDPTFISPTLPYTANSLTCVAIQNDGKILVGGNFPTIHGAAHNGVARLKSDGTFDPDWTSAGVSRGAGLVYDLRLEADGKPIVAGYFLAYDGTPCNGIVRLNPANGSLDPTFANPALATGFGVAALALQPDGKLLIGGGFAVGGNTVSVLRLLGDSSASATAPKITTQPVSQDVPAGSPVTFTVVAESATAMTYQWRHNGQDVAGQRGATLTIPRVDQAAGGVYTVVVSNGSGPTTSDPALLNPVAPGWPDLSFPNTGIGPVHINALCLLGNAKVLAAGAFATMNGFNRNDIARLNPDGTVDRTFDKTTSLTPEIHSVAAQSTGKPIVGGNFGFTTEGVSYANIGRLNLDGTLDRTFNPGTGPNDQVFAVAVQGDDKVLLGGFFNQVNGVNRPMIARLNANGDVDNGFAPNVLFPSVISAIAVQPGDGKVLIGGATGGSIQYPPKRLIRLGTNGLIDPDFNPGTGPNDQVRSIVMQSDGKILIGGQFTAFNGVPRFGVARLNANGSLDPGFDTSTPPSLLSSFVWSLALQTDGRVIAGGAFSDYAGVPRKNIVRLNPNGGVDSSFDPGLGAQNVEVKAVLVLPDARILVAGDFTSFNGIPFNRIVRLHGGGGATGPLLHFTVSGRSLEFNWSDAGFKLQTTASLSPLQWVDVPGASPLTVPFARGEGYYRLVKP
jgi:uncharacterized delta-60 repeat protein